MTTNSYINAARSGFSDLDDIDVAKGLCTLINSGDESASIELDLRECFLDYGPCSIIIGCLLSRLASVEGPCSLVIDLLVDLGSVETMALFLARAAKEITGLQEGQQEVREAVTSYCLEHQISFKVRVFKLDGGDSPAQSSSYIEVHTYDLGSFGAQDGRK